MARYKQKTGIFSIVLWVLIVLGIASLVMQFARKEEAFALEYEGETLEDGTSGFEMLAWSAYDFNLINLPEDLTENSYTVSISPYCKDKKTDFYYTYSTNRKQYSKLTDDLTQCFTIRQRADGFTVLVNHEIGTLLGALHGKTVSIEDGAVDGQADYFKMTVSIAESEQSTSLYFRIGYNLSIDPGYLEF